MRKIVLLMLFILLAEAGRAQQATEIRGTVRNEEGSPVIGASVSQPGSGTGTLTDTDGNFAIRAAQGSTLRVSYVGMKTLEVTVTGSVLNLVMESDNQLDEVVVIGYGTVKRKDLTGAVASINGKGLQATVARNTSAALQGRIAGVTVTNSSGQPGAGMNINIRGLSSLGSNTPLYVIDGVYGDINMVDPADIESMEVLKDASAAAIYGSRAANGVVLITTRGGGKDRPASVAINVYTGVQSITKRLDVLDAQQRITYSYDSRYLITASVRNDGSSRFADGYRYGTFPSVAVGWNVMNEHFFNKASRINDLKLRASYGVLGNQEIGDYSTQSTSTTGRNYIQGGNYWIGTSTGINWVSPKNLTWEETKTSNVGLDMSVLNGKFSLTADYFIQNTNGVLLSIGMPQSAGLGGSPTMNAGVVQNKGIELLLNHNNTVGQVTYNVGINASTVRNRIKDITVGTTQEFAGMNPHGEGTVTWARLGDPIGSFYLIKTDGLFQSDAEVQAHKTADGKLIQPNAKPGDIRFIDFNGDGQISDNDRQYAGSPFPKLSYGIRGNVAYRGLDLGIFFDGVYGNKIYNYTRARMEAMNEINNFGIAALDAWTPQNTGTDVPRFTMEDQNQNRRRVSDRWLEDGSFFRLKTLEMGYTLNNSVLQKIQLKNTRIFAAFENLFVATKYKGYTPDLGQSDGLNGQGSGTFSRGVDTGRFPMARTMMIGLQANY